MKIVFAFFSRFFSYFTLWTSKPRRERERVIEKHIKQINCCCWIFICNSRNQLCILADEGIFFMNVYCFLIVWIERDWTEIVEIYRCKTYNIELRYTQIVLWVFLSFCFCLLTFSLFVLVCVCKIANLCNFGYWWPHFFSVVFD